MISRLLKGQIEKVVHTNKAVIVVGPRQVGKTTLIKEILKNNDYLFLDGDDRSVVAMLAQADTSLLKRIIGTKKYVFVDEAQKIPNIGNALKIIVDQLTGVKLFVSGSSSLQIHESTQESLTGRKFEFELFPISWKEFEGHVGYLEADAQLEHRLIFGMYPDVINGQDLELRILKGLSDSYLYQDVLSLTGIRKPDVLEKLLMALALQVGSEVSFNELAQLLQIDKNTVIKYIDLLERAFIIFTLPSFSRNLRNEIKNNRKIYFVDNGIRNAIINNFNPIEQRNDLGALWENFLVSERRKRNAYEGHFCRSFFWRTTTQREIDYLEESGGTIEAREFKWKVGSKVRFPSNFLSEYNPEIGVIDRSNFRDWI
jgi:predicted AAA+ superfamily ATPase